MERPLLLSEAISRRTWRANRTAFWDQPLSRRSVSALVQRRNRDAAARVTIQQQFSRNLTVTYSTNAATTNQYQLIQVEQAIKHDGR